MRRLNSRGDARCSFLPFFPHSLLTYAPSLYSPGPASRPKRSCGCTHTFLTPLLSSFKRRGGGREAEDGIHADFPSHSISHYPYLVVLQFRENTLLGVLLLSGRAGTSSPLPMPKVSGLVRVPCFPRSLRES